MKNKLKFVGVFAGAAILVSVGFGLSQPKNQSVPLQEQVKKPEIGPIGTTRRAAVTYVFDGDTIEVNGEERVRYLGMNAPEAGQPHFNEATNENKKLVEGKEVKLEFDIQTKDQYGRTLVYIWVGETMVNLELVRRSLANAYTLPPNIRYSHLFLEAEREAREAQLQTF